MSRGFVYTIEMLTLASDTEVRTLLGKPVTMWLRNDNATERRPLHGHVRHLTRLTVGLRGYRLWGAEVAPWLWFLTRSIDCRIYQDLTVPEILRSVFDEHGLSHYDFRLGAQYSKLVFCVQYRESAFAFVSRLMEHVGIFYWFEHHQDRHLLVLSDANNKAPFTQPRQATLSLRPDLGEIQELEHDYTFHTGNWALNDFDFEVPTKNLRTHEPTRLDIEPMRQFEIYDYPGSYTARDHGAGLTRLRMEEEEARHHRIVGSGSCVGFDAGKRFTLAVDEAMGEEKPETYLLTELRHSAREPGYFSTSGEPATDSNRFVAIPAETPFRPERLTDKPVVQGPQTATVVGPAGENIHTDQYGRVRVLFHWDRRGKRDEHASCWIRVSQHAAGSHWGGLATPHVGQEVVVSFLEGDPDRPIVTGHVHNGNNMPPLNLPYDKDKTILRDHGDNRIIMHGKPGRERLSLVSPKNINFVAMRSPAKSLSAAQTIDNVSFDDFYDGASLQELKNVFDQLAKQQPPPGLPATQDDGNRTGNVYTSPSYTIPGSKPPTGETVAEGADMATNVDINSLSEHDINSLSVVNTNTWVGGNSNTWVGGDAHNHIRNLQDDYYLAHQELTPTFHTEETGMHAEVTGIHIEDTEIHIEAHGIPVVQPGIHVEIENGLHYHIGDMDDFFWHNGRFELVDTDIRSYITKTKIAGDDTEIVEVKNIEAGILSVLGTTGVVIVTRGMSIDAFAGMDIYAPTVTIEGALVNIG